MVIYQLISGKYKLVERLGGSHEGVGRKKLFLILGACLVSLFFVSFCCVVSVVL